jgi:hypothetical protein
MAKATNHKLKYSPEVTVWVNETFENDIEVEKDIHIPVPDGQEWLYAVLEKQTELLRGIKKWVTYFGILSILSLIGGVIIWLLAISAK